MMQQNYDIALSNHYKYLTIDIHFLTIIISAKTHRKIVQTIN